MQIQSVSNAAMKAERINLSLVQLLEEPRNRGEQSTVLKT